MAGIQHRITSVERRQLYVYTGSSQTAQNRFLQTLPSDLTRTACPEDLSKRVIRVSVFFSFSGRNYSN